MTTYDNTNRGVLFSERDKSNADDRDYCGSINIEGREFWLSAWVKTSKKGNKFLSLSLKPKDERPSAGGGPRKGDVDDEIPF